MGRRDQRKVEIANLRTQGRLARIEGKSRQSVPWKPFESTNADHWLRGWDEEDEERRQAEVNAAHCTVTDAISEVEDRETQEALYAIWEYVKEKLG